MPNETNIRYSSREIGGALISLFGVLILLSGFLINPWVGKLWKGNQIVNFHDVYLNYFYWSAGIGILVIILGILIVKVRKNWLDSISILVLLICCVLLLDRLLLAKYNLTIWKYDPILHYRHRPEAVRNLQEFDRPKDLVQINSYGHHDSEFEIAKPHGELRILALGDSVTMGFGVTYAETFSKKLEDLLSEYKNYNSYQVINTGVHGYSTSQELKIFKESLKFEPDLVILGFVMNDITEPYVVNTERGGVGLDYHGVMQTPSNLAGYFLNETGFGRILQKFATRSMNFEAEKKREVFDTKEMSGSSLHEAKFSTGWNDTLTSLEEIYSIASSHNMPVLLLIFPFTYQLNNDALRMPQKILKEHAQERNVEFIDFTEVFEEAIYSDRELLLFMSNKGYTPNQIESFYQWKVDKYFFDEDHFTALGHEIVALKLLEYLLQKEVVGK